MLLMIDSVSYLGCELFETDEEGVYMLCYRLDDSTFAYIKNIYFDFEDTLMNREEYSGKSNFQKYFI